MLCKALDMTKTAHAGQALKALSQNSKCCRAFGFGDFWVCSRIFLRLKVSA